MLEKINYFDRKKSVYSCDMCGKRLEFEDRHTLYHRSEKTGQQGKLYDLCEHCYNLIIKGIVVYKKRRQK